MLDQILVDRHRVAPFTKLRLDERAVRLAGAPGEFGVGGHFRSGVRF
jgi:hypothetical protein